MKFSDLRNANKLRLPHFKDSDGNPCHKPDGSDWSDSDWLMAVCGELGELAGVRKKVRRGDITMDEALPDLASELADVVIYLDILAFRMGIDLEKAVLNKFNKVSEKIGSSVTL